MMDAQKHPCRFVLIRHGQTYWNRVMRMQGQINIPLNDVGKRQAANLARELQGYDFDVCYCSPLNRAVETAQTVIGSRDIPFIRHELLLEQSYGLCEGQWQPLVFRLPFARLYNYQHHPERYVPAVGGESMRDMLERAGRALNEALLPAARTYHTVLVGAHGSLICAMLDWIEKTPLQDYWGNLLNNCGYAVIEHTDGAWRVVEKH